MSLDDRPLSVRRRGVRANSATGHQEWTWGAKDMLFSGDLKDVQLDNITDAARQDVARVGCSIDGLSKGEM